VIAQFVAIVSLLTAISWDYSQNPAMQQWFANNASIIGSLLANYVGTIVVVTTGAGFLAWKLKPRRIKSKPT